MPAFLIVDADRNFRDALAIALRLDGHVAVTTGDTDEAHAQLAADRFDCCVADAHLPGTDALLERAARAGIRVIATGPYPDLLAVFASRHPHAETLPKPLRASDLAAPVGRAARCCGSRPSAGEHGATQRLPDAR